MTAAQAISQHGCDLGKWLYAGGLEVYAGWPSIGALAGAEKTFPKIDLYSQQAIALPKQAGQDAAAR